MVQDLHPDEDATCLRLLVCKMVASPASPSCFFKPSLASRTASCHPQETFRNSKDAAARLYSPPKQWLCPDPPPSTSRPQPHGLQAMGHPFYRWGDAGFERSWAWVEVTQWLCPPPSLGAPWAPGVAETMGGQEAEPHSRPYMAGIHSSSVLPTAHCLGSSECVEAALP